MFVAAIILQVLVIIDPSQNARFLEAKISSSLAMGQALCQQY